MASACARKRWRAGVLQHGDSDRLQKKQKIFGDACLSDVSTDDWTGFQRGADISDAKSRIQRGIDARYALGALLDPVKVKVLLDELTTLKSDSCLKEGQEKVAQRHGQEEVSLDVLGGNSSSEGLAFDAAVFAEVVSSIPADFGILLVVGPNGSGVSSALSALQQRFAVPPALSVSFASDKSVAAEVKAARDWFPAVGLNDIKAWCHPFYALSNGQRQRVRLARQLSEIIDPSAGTIIDDLGAAVDGADARAIAYSLGQCFRGRSGAAWKRVVVGTHADLSAFLQPDFVLQLPGDGSRPRLTKNPNPLIDRKVHVSLDIGKMGHLKLPEDQPIISSNRVLRAHLSEEITSVWSRKEKCETEDMVAVVAVDDYTQSAAAAFEVEFNGTVCKQVPILKHHWVEGTKWRLGLVIGPSGSGKTTALKRVLHEARIGNRSESLIPGSGLPALPDSPWDEQETIQDAMKVRPGLAEDILDAVGLTRGAWGRPFRTLSSSEKSRASLARSLVHAVAAAEVGESSPVLIDEFTTEMDRCSAQSLCISLRSWLEKNTTCVQLVIATVFEDTCAWFGDMVDWAFLTNRGLVVPRPRVPSLVPVPLPADPNLDPPRLAVELNIVENKDEKLKLWSDYFHKHHYLSGDLNLSAHVFLVRERCTRAPVAFLAVKTFPGFQYCECHYGNKSLVAEHRLVVLPAWQNFGLGTRLSNEIGMRVTAQGEKYIGKTAHPRLALHRERSLLWKRSGNFLAEIHSLEICNDGWVYLRGPSPKFQIPSNQAMVFDIRHSDAPAQILAALQGRTLAASKGADKQICFKVCISVGELQNRDLGSHHFEGHVVFYQPSEKVVVQNKFLATLKGLGPDSWNLVCCAGKGAKENEHILRLTNGRAGRARNGLEPTAPAVSPGLDGPKKVFDAVALLALAGSDKQSELANVRCALARLREGKPLPSEVVEAVRGGLKVKAQRLLKKRLVFSYEFVRGA